MDNKIILEFVKNLIKNVRDTTIKSCDSQLAEGANSSIAKRWRELIDSNNIAELQKAMIVDCIDDALFHLLDAIDNNQLRLAYITDKNENIVLSEKGLGEMAGSYASNDWNDQFSEERVPDNFSDLDIDF